MYNEIGDSMLIDTHLHLSTEDFHEDEIKDVLRQARLNHVLKYIVCGCSKSEIKNVIEVSKLCNYLYITNNLFMEDKSINPQKQNSDVNK